MSSMIPRSHPRYESLMTRERMSHGLKKGWVHETGLIAHGRGEAFDYLIGETTQPFSDAALKVAAEKLMRADHPVFSVNGNVVALVAKDCVRLSQMLSLPLEVNLFHRSEKRVSLLIDELKKHGAEQVLGMHPTKHIAGLDHHRGWCEEKGIFAADVVLVPLEDGDRCQALKRMGKYVITIDLNPLSRTAKTADITIVDNIIRALPRLMEWIEQMKVKDLHESFVEQWDNQKNLKEVYHFLSKRINQME